MGRVLSFTDAVAKSPAQAVLAASGAFSADDIIFVMKVGFVFIIIITVAFSIWRSLSSASSNAGNLISSSPAGTVDLQLLDSKLLYTPELWCWEMINLQVQSRNLRGVLASTNQDGGISNRGEAQTLLEGGILMGNLLTGNSTNEGSTDTTGVLVPTILAVVGEQISG
ncbi:unnamed protein product [Sphagnum tenellum]